MARFDVYANTGGHADTTPYLLDVQSDLLNEMDSRVVIPLRSLAHFPKIRLPARLTPSEPSRGTDCLLETPKMGAVPLRVLKSPVTSLAPCAGADHCCIGFSVPGLLDLEGVRKYGDRPRFLLAEQRRPPAGSRGGRGGVRCGGVSDRPAASEGYWWRGTSRGRDDCGRVALRPSHVRCEGPTGRWGWLRRSSAAHAP